MSRVQLEVRVLSSRETPEAHYIQKPNSIKFCFLPKSEVEIIGSSDKGGLFKTISIPRWLSDEHDLD